MNLITRYALAAAPFLFSVTATLGQGSDNCASAVAQALAIGSSITLTGDNSTASGTNDFVAGSPYEGAPVYWHKFTTTACADLSISYCSQSPVWSNTFGILANACPADVLVNANTFNDVDCGDGNRTYYFTNLPAGTWSLPILNDPGNNSSGPFTITVTATACNENNDFCTGLIAQQLASGSSLIFSDDNGAASGINDFDANSPYFGAPVFWHKFSTDACNDVTVSYCGQDPAWTNVFGILATDCPGNNLVNTSALNTTECGDGNTTFHYDQLPAGVYYLPVLSDVNSGSAGPYSVTVSASACVENNDFCAQVFPQNLASGSSLTFSADNTSATGTNDFDPNSPYFGAPVSWHAFTTNGCNNVTVSYCAQNPAWTNVFGILATDCPALTLINASILNTTDCGNGNATFIFNALAAGTYYLPVLADGGSGSIGAYSIEVSAQACPVNNDFCTEVPVQNLPWGSSLTFTGDNTNAGGTGDFVPTSPYAGTPVYWHAFTTTGCTDVVVAYCGTAPSWSNTLAILANSCPGDELTQANTFNTTACVDGNRTIFFDNLPPGTWYLPVLSDVPNNSAGPYTILVTAEDCATGLEEDQATGNWTVYPNPSEGVIQVMCSDPAQGTVVLVTDMTGRTVIERRIPAHASGPVTLTADGDLATGSYMVQFISPSGRAVRHVVVR